MKINNLILGGGISGQVASHLLGWPILERNDYLMNRLLPGLFYLHPSYDMDILLDGLRLSAAKIEIKPGILWNGDIVPFIKLEKEERLKAADRYCYKTRGCSVAQVSKNDCLSLMDGILSERTKQRYVTTSNQLLERLNESVKDRVILNAEVITVDVDRKYVQLSKRYHAGEIIHYKHLISTIPFTKSFGSYIGNNELWATDSYWFELDVKEEVSSYVDYVYIPGDDSNIDRIVYPYNLGLSDDKNIVWFETLVRDEINFVRGIHDLGNEGKIINSGIHCNKTLYGQPYLKPLEEKDIHFIGRYAKWDNSLLVKDAVKEVRDIGKNICQAKAE